MLDKIGQVLGLASSAKSLFDGGGGSEGSSMKKQYAWNMYSAQQAALNLPRYQVKGLRNAGLNPMLALGMGGNMPSSSSHPITSSPGKDADIATAKALAAATTANQAAQAKLYNTQAENVQADTADKLLKPAETTERTALLKAQAATEAWGPENRKWATELLSAQYGKTVAEKDAIYQWQRKITEALTGKYAKETELLIQEVRSAKTKADVDEALLKIERLVGIGAEGLGAVSGAVSSASGLKRAIDAAKPRTRSGSRTRYKNTERWTETTD